MKPVFIGHPIATALFLFTLGVWMVIEVRRWLERRTGATDTDRGSILVLRLFAAAGILSAGLVLEVTATAFPHVPDLCAAPRLIRAFSVVRRTDRQRTRVGQDQDDAARKPAMSA